MCVEEKGLASVARACREAGLDSAALCGVPNADVLQEVYKIEEWGVRTKLMNRARTYRRAEEQQGAPASTDGGAAAAAEGSRRSRAAELTSAVPRSASAAITPPAGLSASFAFKMPGSVAGAKPAFSFGAAASQPPGPGVFSFGAAASAPRPPGPFTFKVPGSTGAKPAFSSGQGSAPASQPAFFSGPAPATTAASTASKSPAGSSVPFKMPGFTFKMPGPPEDAAGGPGGSQAPSAGFGVGNVASHAGSLLDKINPESTWYKYTYGGRSLYQDQAVKGRAINSRRPPAEGVKKWQYMSEKSAAGFESNWEKAGKTDADIEAGLNPRSTWCKVTCGERAYYCNKKVYSLVPPGKGVRREEEVAAGQAFTQEWGMAVADDSSAMVQLLRYRTPTTSPPWPVRCLCFSRTVGTSVQLTVRAWCPNENCASFHLHWIATSRGCSRRRRGSCSPRWLTRD
eukprot:SAG25_NODE_28_length_20925_cov_13.342839_3_plen_456_part_00